MKSIRWSSGTTSTRENPKHAEQIRSEIAESLKHYPVVSPKSVQPEPPQTKKN